MVSSWRTPTKVSRMMTGVLRPTLADAAALLAICGVVGDERDHILDLCHPRHDGDALRLSDGTQWDAFLYYAQDAVRMVEYQPLMIPWIAQTKSYRETCWSSSAPQQWPGKFDHDGAATLWLDKASVELLVDEAALRILVGPARVGPSRFTDSSALRVECGCQYGSSGLIKCCRLRRCRASRCWTSVRNPAWCTGRTLLAARSMTLLTRSKRIGRLRRNFERWR